MWVFVGVLCGVFVLCLWGFVVGVRWFMVFWFDGWVGVCVDYFLVAASRLVRVVGLFLGWFQRFCWGCLGCGGVVCELDSVFVFVFMPVFCF